MNGGNGSTLWTYLVSLNRTLKIVKMIKFVYFTTIFKVRKKGIVLKLPKLANRMLFFKIWLATIEATSLLPHKNNLICRSRGEVLAGISTAIYWGKLYCIVVNPNWRKSCAYICFCLNSNHWGLADNPSPTLIVVPRIFKTLCLGRAQELTNTSAHPIEAGKNSMLTFHSDCVLFAVARACWKPVTVSP